MLLEFFACRVKGIIQMFCNIWWLIYRSVVYEKTIWIPLFSIDYFVDFVPNCFAILFVIFQKFPIVWFFTFSMSTIMLRKIFKRLIFSCLVYELLALIISWKIFCLCLIHVRILLVIQDLNLSFCFLLVCSLKGA